MKKTNKFIEKIKDINNIIDIHLFSKVAKVKGNSMEPTFNDGDKIRYESLDSNHIGDLCIHYSELHQCYMFKRIIALPGDKVEWISGTLYLNDEETDLVDPRGGYSILPLVVPEGVIYLCGDNLSVSSDSRKSGPVSSASVTSISILKVSSRKGAFKGIVRAFNKIIGKHPR